MKLVILPGLNGTADFLADISHALSGFSVEIIDYPLNLFGYEAITEMVMERLPDEPFVLIAESYSGPVAGNLAAIGADNLKGIVFVASFLTRPRYLPSFMAYALYLLPFKSRLGIRIADKVTMGRWSRSEFVILFHKVLTKIPRRTIVSRLCDVLSLGREFSHPRVPVLYLRPNQDRLIPRRIPMAFEHVDRLDGPHFILQARPKDTAKIITKFVDSLTIS